MENNMLLYVALAMFAFSNLVSVAVEANTLGYGVGTSTPPYMLFSESLNKQNQ